MNMTSEMQPEIAVAALAEAVTMLCDRTHGNAPECGQCPLWMSDLCVSHGELYGIVRAIAEGEGGAE